MSTMPLAPHHRVEDPRIMAGAELQRATRAGVALLLALALANGLYLYVLPGRAETDYAWPIALPINAAFLGAGFLAGCVATGLVVFATRHWRSLRMLAPPLFVLATTLFAATLIDAGSFRWDYPPTWVWTAVYGLVPAGVVVLWRRQERTRTSEPAHPELRLLRACSLALGAVIIAIGLLLFAAPDAMADVWPWPIARLMSHVLAGWYLMAGTILVACAATLRRAREAVIPYATLLAWTVLLLALPLLHADDTLDGGRTAAWVALHLALLVLTAYALLRAFLLMRAERDRL